MRSNFLTSVLLYAFSVTAVSVDTRDTEAQTASSNGCKCAPTDSCWPSTAAWKALNTTLGGKLITNTPAATVCYPPLLNLPACATVLTGLTNSTFVANDAIALGYPIKDSCPAVDYSANATPGTCSIGDAPRYTVDATTPAHVAAGVVFAKANNLRLVVRNTGHDILGRSTGYGSLEIWIRHLRQGILFQQTYTPSDKCDCAGWSGSAFTIKGGYVWGDVYGEASKRNVIVVGGGDPSVGCIGGWAQGGGHSPASSQFGLGADQILEATVVLASGAIVTANACQNTDLFFAIRGGGGGTYGVVVSTTVKAHPNTNVVAQTLAVAPFTTAQTPAFMEALAIIYSSVPNLNDAGYSGYGSWAYQSYAPVFATFTTGYAHALAIYGKTQAQAESIFAPVNAKLQQYNTSLVISVQYINFPNYAAYYSTLSGGQSSVGSSGAALGSRFLDRAALTRSSSTLKTMLNVTAGKPGEFASSNLCIVSGGQVKADAADQNSGVNPAWRTAHIHNVVARGWAPGTPVATQKLIADDITFTKVGAMRAIAPNTGSYMNEGDRRDPQYLVDFYGLSLSRLQAAKKKYDPTSLFYCPTCVGSNAWAEDSTGRLCPASSSS